MIGFTVIGGYLGAGKTTLLNHLLSVCDDRRLGVLVNDFGAINIDAGLIDSRSETTISLTNGCICCTMSDGFSEAIDQLLEARHPVDHIVIEASGVADVRQLAQYGRHPGLHLDGVLVVADAETLPQQLSDRYIGSTVQRQLEAADLVVLNKVDLVAEAELRARLEWFGKVCPQVRVVPSQRGWLPMNLLLGINSQRLRGSGAVGEHPHYVSWHVNLAHAVTKQALEGFAKELDPAVLRVKGIVSEPGSQALVLQVVGRRWEVLQVDVFSVGDRGKDAAPTGVAPDAGVDPRVDPAVAPGVQTGTQLVAIGLKGQLNPQILIALATKWLH